MDRVLPADPFASLQEYEDAGGGEGLRAARAMDPAAVIDVIDASGLRGRGGAGFPTGRKWRTVVANHSAIAPTTVVVNAAEGEPGSFKDRWILRQNPYAVLEGALVAAVVVTAAQVIVATKSVFTEEITRVDAAIGELEAAGWTEGIDIAIFEGPGEYLFGEETALLESIDGRYPFPRIAPPYRRGVDEIVESADEVDSGSGSAAHVELAGAASSAVAPPTLVNNTETFANIPGILANGADWFRAIGTTESPGTIVCTVSGHTRRAGVAEVAMGTPLREVIDAVGGGAMPGQRIVAVLSGVANALVAEAQLDTPLSYEGMVEIGSGLGTGGFIVFDDTTDFAALAAGIAKFLAVESCGQCARCKEDGLGLADAFARVARSRAEPGEADHVRTLLRNVAEGARCNLALQQQIVGNSILDLFPAHMEDHLQGRAEPAEPAEIAAIVSLAATGVVLDEHQRDKQPDWTFDAEYSGKWPADRLDEHRAPQEI